MAAYAFPADRWRATATIGTPWSSAASGRRPTCSPSECSSQSFTPRWRMGAFACQPLAPDRCRARLAVFLPCAWTMHHAELSYLPQNTGEALAIALAFAAIVLPDRRREAARGGSPARVAGPRGGRARLVQPLPLAPARSPYGCATTGSPQAAGAACSSTWRSSRSSRAGCRRSRIACRRASRASAQALDAGGDRAGRTAGNSCQLSSRSTPIRQRSGQPAVATLSRSLPVVSLEGTSTPRWRIASRVASHDACANCGTWNVAA